MRAAVAGEHPMSSHGKTPRIQTAGTKRHRKKYILTEDLFGNPNRCQEYIQDFPCSPRFPSSFPCSPRFSTAVKNTSKIFRVLQDFLLVFRVPQDFQPLSRIHPCCAANPASATEVEEVMKLTSRSEEVSSNL